MKLNTLIIDDNENEYLRIVKVFSEFPFLNIVGHYFGNKPFEPAIEFINLNHPQLLVIDWNLSQGSQKTGEELFRKVNKYQCFAIFTSRDFEGSVSAIPFDNSKFLQKRVGEIMFEVKYLNEILNKCLIYLVGHTEIKRRYYYKDIVKGTKSFEYDKFKIKDLVYFLSRGKECQYTFRDVIGEFKHREGPIDSSGDFLKVVQDIGYPNLIIHGLKPLTIYNNQYFEFKLETKLIQLRDEYKGFKFNI